MNHLVKTYEESTPHSADYLKARRAKERNYSTRKILAIGALALAVVGGSKIAQQFEAHPRETVTEIVQPNEGAWSVTQRAERDAGIDPNSRDIRPTVENVIKRYGPVLHPGQEIAITLEK